MEDQDLREWIRKLVHEEHELFQQEAKGGATDAMRERGRELEEYLDQCWDLSDSAERNEQQASIPKLPAFATSKRLSTTTNEDELVARSLWTCTCHCPTRLPRVALALGVTLFTEARSTER